MLKHWIAGVVCLAVMACGSSSDDSEDANEGEGGDVCASTGLDFTSGDATAGAEIFSGFCESCHGADGLGMPNAAAASSRGIDLHDEINEPLADDCWVKVVKNGEGEMAPVAGITDQQIVDVLAYMKATYTAEGGGGGEGGEGGEGGGDVCAASGLDFTAGDATAGEEIFSGFCASCHGADGMGIPDAGAPGSRGIDLHDEINEPLADDCWVKVIKGGEGDMAPVAGITDQQILDVLAYMKANYTH